MNKKATVFLPIAGAIALLGAVATQTVFSKAHVPLDKAQVCHNGVTKTLKLEALEGHLSHGDCQLPACDFENIFISGTSCPADGDNDGLCDVENDRATANGVTPACSPF